MEMSLRRYVWGLALAVLLVLGAGNAFAATISGTVSNTSGKSGRIYLKVVWDDTGDYAGCGKSLAAPGAFTIRGLQYDGYFRVYAFMDTTGSDGVQTPSDPIGESGVIQVMNGQVSGSANVVLKPSTNFIVPTAKPVYGGGAIGGNGCAVVVWDNENDSSDHGEFVGDSLVVEWSKDNFVTRASKTLTSLGDSPLWVSGLSNGATYKFRIISKVGTQTATVSAGSATIGAPAGYAISGTVQFSGLSVPAGTPLLLFLEGDTAVRVGYYASVSNGMAFSVKVPNGTYNVYSALDMNKNGIIDVGDSMAPELSSVVVNGANVTGKTLTFYNNPVDISVESSVRFEVDGSRRDSIWSGVWGQRKFPVNAYVTSPNLPMGIDMGVDNDGIETWSGVNAPLIVGDTYTYTIGFSDGTTATFTKKISAVYTGGPTNLTPKGTVTTSPTALKWTLNNNANLLKGWVNVSLWGGNGIYYEEEDLSPNTTSYPIPEKLSNGTYSFMVEQCDNGWNCVRQEAQFTVSAPAVKPATLTVPTSSPLGTPYTVSWGASATPDATYELQESTVPTFSTATTYNAFSTSYQLSKYSAGTFYYRVRAKAPGYTASPWTTVITGCAVPGTATAGVPASITVPASDADGAFVLNWGASATTGVTYWVQEATNAAFTADLRTAYFGPGLTTNILGRAAGKTYYYRVRALKAGLKDSVWKAGANGCIIVAP